MSEPIIPPAKDSDWTIIGRFIVLGTLAYIALTTTQSKEGVQDLKRDTKEMREKSDEDRKEIRSIKEGLKNFATKDEMTAAEQRIRNELADQIKRQPAITEGKQ